MCKAAAAFLTCIPFALGGVALAQASPPPKLVRVIAFDGGFNLPIWAAQRQGFFEENGIRVELGFTPNSGFLIKSLLDGKSDLALASIDNVIAYQEGQGEAKIADNPDLFAFMGGDNGFLTLVTAPSIKTFAELRGKTLSVDAMTTGFAFVLRELLTRNGLGEADVKIVRAGATANRYRELVAGTHHGTLLRTPFEIMAKDRGFNLLATGTQALGSYMGTVGVARRSWARENEAALVGFLRGYRAAMRWLDDSANRQVAEALLVANVRDMTPALAQRSYTLLLAPKDGLIRDLGLDLEGIKTVLTLRSKFGEPKKALADPLKYIDTSYAEKASHKPEK
jgi:ABC-type nitrate/sulfonate/bicarbonate transport system substrate-binding protein